MRIQNQISDWLNAYLLKNKLSAFVIGVSGGIDSAVTSTLCAMTNKKTILVIMPIQQNPNETARGEKHFNCLSQKYKNIEIFKMDLTNLYTEYLSTIPKKFHNKLMNTFAFLLMKDKFFNF